MDMRTGKSLTCLRWLDIRNPEGVRVIVAPTTVLCGWERELSLEGKTYDFLAGRPAKKRREMLLHGAGQYKLINYESLLHTDDLKRVRLGAVVLDESVCIKDARTKTCKFILRYLTRAKCRAILSGLPNPQDDSEIWTQMAFACGGTWMGHRSFWTWRQKYALRCGYDWVLPPKNLLVIKAHFHQDAYILTRHQANLGNVKVYQTRQGDMHPEVRKIYRESLRTWEIPGVQAKTHIEVANWLRRMASGVMPYNNHLPCWKYDELIKLLTQELHDSQVVVWFAFNSELARVWRLLRSLEISATWITGTSTIAQRRKRMSMFSSGRRRVMLCQLKCGRYGLDFATADTAVYFSNSYSYNNRRQSEDRVESIHKKRDLLIIDMVTRGSADETVMEVMKDRHGSTASFLSRLRGVAR